MPDIFDELDAPAAKADIFDEVAPEKPKQALGDMARRIPAGIAKASADALVGVGRIGKTIQKASPLGVITELIPPLKDVTEAVSNAGMEYVAGLGETAASSYGVDESQNATIPSKIISGASSIVPAIASGPAAPLTIAGMMGEQQRQEAEAAGGTEKQKNIAFVGGATVGALSEFLLGVPALLRSAKAAGVPQEAFKSLTRTVAEQAIKSAGREGAQEGVEQIAQNLIASKIAGYDPKRGTFENVPEAVALGAAIGGPTGGIVQAAASIDASRARNAALAEAVNATIDEVASSEPPPVTNDVEVRPGVFRTENPQDIPADVTSRTEITVGGKTVYEYRPKTSTQFEPSPAVQEAPSPVTVDVTQGGVRTEEVFQPGEEQPSTVVETPAAGIVPAVRVGDKVILGKQGETHQDIVKRYVDETGDVDALNASLDPGNRLFMTPDGRELSREELRAETGVAFSEDLRDLQATAAETTGPQSSQPTQQQPALPTTESSQVQEGVSPTQSEPKLSAAQLNERIDTILQKHQAETDATAQAKLWSEAKSLMAQLDEAERQSMGPGAASAAEALATYAARKFGINFQDNPAIAKELKEAAGNRFYEVLPNKVTAQEAVEVIDRVGEDEAERLIRDDKADASFAVRSTIGQILIKRLNEQYNKLKQSSPEEAQTVLNRAADLAEWQMDFGTRLGQGVQSFAMWMRLTAEGKVLGIKKMVRKAREKHRQDNQQDVDEVLDVINSDRTVQEKEKEVRKIAGRNKVARRIRKKVRKLSEKKQTPESFYDTTATDLGLPELTPEQETKLKDLAAKVDAAPEGLPKWKASTEFLGYAGSIKGFSLGDLTLGYFYGNILSGFGTQIVNAVDTFLNVAHEVNTLAVTNPKAAATIYEGLVRGIGNSRADALLALTKNRKVSSTDLGQSTGIMETAKFGQKGGVPLSGAGLASKTAKAILESKAGLPLNAWKYVGRAMAASDTVMFRGAQEARAGLLAYRIATEEGLTTSQRTKRVNEILGWDRYDEFLEQAKTEGFEGTEQQARATELMIMQRPEGLNSDATEFGTSATYNNTPKGVMGKFSRSLRGLSGEVPALRLVIPFTNIVANVFNRRLDNLPGVALYRSRQGYYETPEAGKNAVMRMYLSLAMMGGVMAMVKGGLIDLTGSGPDDYEKKKQLKETGWRPYSIKIGKNYISYANTPISLGLGIMGNMMDWSRYKKNDEDSNRSFVEATTYSVIALGSYLFSQNFLSGMANMFEILSSGSKGKTESAFRTFAGNTVSAFFPMSGAMKDLSDTYDDRSRVRRRLEESVIAGLPFIRYAGKPAINAFGEEVRTGQLRPVARFANREKDDPAWRVIADQQLRVPVPDPFFKTDAENYEYQKVSGQRMKRWVLDSTELLKRLPKEEAQEAMNDAGNIIRKSVRGEMLGKGAAKKEKK